MARRHRRELRGVCEALRTALRDHIPLTRLRLDVIVSGMWETFVSVEPHPSAAHPGYMSASIRPRANVIVPIHDEAGAIGTLTVEHDARELETQRLQTEIENVAIRYAPVLRACTSGARPGPRSRRPRARAGRLWGDRGPPPAAR
jgi:hypothetical protein